MVIASAAATKHPVDQVLPFRQMFVYGLQHVLSMYAGVVAVPLIVGSALELTGAITDEDESRIGGRDMHHRGDAGQGRRERRTDPGHRREHQ